MMIELSCKIAHFAQKSTKKILARKVESFVKSDFDLNQICKTVLTQNH